MVWNKGLKDDPRCKGGRPKSSLSYVGQTYGRLTVLNQYSKKKSIYFTCKCECGVIKDFRKDCISGPTAETVSCGCRINELYSERRKMGQKNRDEGKDVVSAIWSRAKYRAKQKGLDFTIEQKDIIIPDKCPLLGINIIPKAKDRIHSPSLDRIDSTKGYTPDNVWIISNRANTLKNDASLQELELLVENLKRL